jgi:hypothetical protein
MTPGLLTQPSARAATDTNRQSFPNPTGIGETMTTADFIDTSNPFFQSLGTNGRTCFTCHRPAAGWTITPADIQLRFAVTDGLDPIFRPHDAANSPQADVSTEEAKRRAYSMLLTKGLIRVGIGIPPGAEFELAAVDDPYSFASARELSLFRRPLPATNMAFLSAVMWDGRFGIHPITGPPETALPALRKNLAIQALDATMTHAQARALPTEAQLEEIVEFTMDLFTAQSADKSAGSLDLHGGRGGPDPLSAQEFFIGINDPLGLNPTGAPFDPKAFTLYDAWESAPGRGRLAAARASVLRGQALFNTRPIAITGVSGLNDELNQAQVDGFCTTCHNSPNVGSHSVAAPLNIGLTDASRRTPDMPLYTLRHKRTGEVKQTTDPGRALISGKWKDIGRFKGPILRGLAARPPYFHNGFAAGLDEVVEFYDERFAMQLTKQEKADLVAFLRTL